MVLVTGYPFRTPPSVTLRSKIRRYYQDNGGRSTFVCPTFLLVKDAPDDFFTESWKRVSYDTIKAIKLTDGTPGARKKNTVYKFPVLDAEGRFIERPVDFAKEKVLFMSSAEAPGYASSRNYYHNNTAAQLYAVLAPMGYTVIILAQNRWAKYLREYPKTTSHLRKAGIGDGIIQKWHDAITPDDVWHESLTDEDRKILGYLAGRVDILDQAVLDSIKRFDKNRTATLRKRQSLVETAARFCGYGASSKLLTRPAEDSKIFDAYPLVQRSLVNTYARVATQVIDETVFYMNARYKEGI
jgi:hypothetical protein